MLRRARAMSEGFKDLLRLLALIGVLVGWCLLLHYCHP